MCDILLQKLERVRTFQISKWRYFDSALLSPYRLASCGYSCVDVNTVQCHTCHNRVSMITPEQKGRQFQQINEDLNNHDDLCAEKGQIGKLIEEGQLYLNMDEIMSKIKNTYIKYNLEGKKNLPILNSEGIWNAIKKQSRFQTVKIIMSKYQIDPEEFRISFILTLFGWMILQSQPTPRLQCFFCGRVVHCDNKQCTQDGKQKNILNLQKQKVFDPIGEHRYFCIWNFGFKGWNTCIQHLWDKLGESQYLFKKEKPQEVKKVRIHLDKYLQSFNKKTGQACEKIKETLKDCEEMVTLLEGNDEEQKEILKNDYEKRRQTLSQFIESIDVDIKKPIKRIKID